MVLALLTTSLLSVVCFITTAVLGFMMQGRLGVGNHFLFGVFTTFLVTLSQSMTMFYFIGTGKQVREPVTQDEKGPEFVRRTKIFKAKVFPPALWAMLFTMATMIVGGGVDVRTIPPLVHSGLATIALYFNVVALWRDAKYMIEHNMLMQEIEKRLPITK